MRLSILICSLEKRAAQLASLLEDLEEQRYGNYEVEILPFIDNGETNTGAKRNRLLELAKGDYICFVDDDDSVEYNYLSLILNAIETNPDVVGLKGMYYNDGIYMGMFVHSMQYTYWEQKSSTYLRCPNHLNPVKREIALQTKFPEITFGEDRDYSDRMFPLLKTEVMIDQPIYNYYSEKK
jgi:glycosyltransferase involved in cell wall biosynthesis